MRLTPSAILFDCDGVLVQTEPVWFDILTSMLEARQLPTDFLPAQFVGKALLDCIRIIEAATGVSLGCDFAPNFRAAVSKLEPSRFEPSESAAAVLSTLRSSGVSIAVVSNSPYEQVRTLLRAAGLFELLSDQPIVTAPEIGSYKPNPRPYLVAANAVDCDITDCLVVEDSDPGLVAATLSGARVIAYNHVCNSPRAHTDPEQHIRNLREILSYFDLG